MNKVIFFLSVSMLAFASCDTVKSKTKDTVNKSGEAVGKVAAEFIEGVTEGVENALAIDLKLSEELVKSGVKTGKTSAANYPKGGKNNLLTVYFTFEKDIEKTVIATAYDKKDLESGRAKLRLKGKAGEAKYIDFEFDPKTYLGVKSKVVIE